MSAQGPPPGAMPFNPEQIQRMIAMEAQKRGMTVQQFQEQQRRQVEEAAAAAGMSIQDFVAMKQEEMRQNAMRAQQEAAAAAQQPQGGQPPQPGQQPQQAGQQSQQLTQINIHNPPQPKPEALSVAKFLRGQNLKCRTCIFEGQRKDMFKVKRALRALHSPAYQKARAKDPLLPAVETEEQARSTLQLLPLSVLALRVVKKDPHEGHDHAKVKEKRVKGLWTVQIHGQQEFDPMMHYMWLFEGSQFKTKIWSVLALIAAFTVVLFPLWPLFMRQGVWYLSVGAMGLLGLFFGMAIVRLIIFCVTVFTTPPGFWLFPNLFEDVGFFDSFKPLWGWQETKETKKAAKDAKKAKKTASVAKGTGLDGTGPAAEVIPATNGAAVSTSAEPASATALVTKRHTAPTVEEADDE